MRVGTIAGIQTCGSLAAKFHRHVHALVTESAFHTRGDEAALFERVEWWNRSAGAGADTCPRA
ncbi:MAG TPA: hypothetical protein VKA86_18445, partial [Candidatus Krumholzibacteria bacterium]|nr:hypothetical protein [Candidatus Krumholzibacteria bacterium]